MFTYRISSKTEALSEIFERNLKQQTMQSQQKWTLQGFKT